MNRAAGTAEILWEVQDLRERLVLARAEQVKTERLIREIVRDPRNRRGLGGRCPAYVDPADAVAALSGEMSSLYYVIRPGMKNRIKPEVLMRRYESTMAVVESLTEYLTAAEARAHAAGIDTTEALP